MNRDKPHRCINRIGFRSYLFTVLFILVIIWPSFIDLSEAVIGAGDNFTMAVNRDGTLLTWGSKTSDEETTGAAKKNDPVEVKDSSGKVIQGIRAITVGDQHVLILKNDGMLQAWGNNRYGQLGDNTVSDQVHPVAVKDSNGNDLTDIVAFAAGHSHSIALKKDGTLLSWGDNRRGQLGDGTQNKRLVPLPVRDASHKPINDITAVTAGWAHNVALRRDGTLLAWGKNNYGQLGDGTMDDRAHPIRITDGDGKPLTGIVKIAAGVAHSIALHKNGSVYTWGDNREGQLGDGSKTTRLNPVIITDTEHAIIDITAGYYHSAALRSDGSLLVWGWNKYGQLGDGTANNRLKPVFVRGSNGKAVSGIIAIAAGSTHTVVIGSEGKMIAWGDNRYGQLGNTNVIEQVPYPVMVMDSYPARMINKSGAKAKMKTNQTE